MPFVASENALVSKFKGASLVIADVSRGNVGQLAADLFITTMQMRRVGYFDDPDVLAAVGMESGKLRVNTELFASHDSSLFVLQHRSSAISSKEETYGERLGAWISESAFGKVLLLSSLPAEMRKDELLAGGPQLSVGVCGGSDGVASTRNRAELLGWKCVSFSAEVRMEEGEAEWMLQHVVGTEATPLSRSILHCLAGKEKKKEKNESEALCIYAWCAEGDNIGDGIQMATWANDYLNLLPSAPDGKLGWKVPESWRILMTQNAPRPVYT